MNSYNENLHSSVLESLQGQELDLKKMNSQSNASMFALYYAQDATFTATEKLEDAKAKQKNAEKRKKQAIDNSNISGNLLLSANQANEYQKQSVTNAAVAAANVQVAANSIMRLASDMGSIMGILGASNYLMEISTHAETAKQLINDTAKVAELASKAAMDASVLTARVSASTLLDKAKSTNNSIGDLLKVIASDYAAKSQVVSTDNATLATVSVQEKQAEGVYEDADTMGKAATQAYNAINNGLNLGLTATVVKDSTVAGQDSSNTFNVKFEYIRSPFVDPVTTPPVPLPLYQYPVAHYYLFVVKETQKNTFLISSAENIISSHSDRYILLDKFFPNALPIVADDGTVKRVFDQNFDYTKIPYPAPFYLKDSDGSLMQPGINYTVFIVAEYTNEYKMKLNTFDNFLSAPSQAFCLTHQLKAASAVNFKPPSPIPYPLAEKGNTVVFQASQNPLYADKVSYRCIFLPVSAAMSLNNNTALNTVDGEIKTLHEGQAVGVELKTLITKDRDDTRGKINAAENNGPNQWLMLLDKLMGLYEAKINEEVQSQVKKEKGKETAHIREILVDGKIIEQLRQDFLALTQNDKVNLSARLEASGTLGNLPNLTDDSFTAESTSPSPSTTAFIDLLLQERIDILLLDILKNLEEMAELEINRLEEKKIGFMFNLTLAEQVSAGNFTPASRQENSATQVAPTDMWEAPINSSTTDNFGNPLSSTKTYIPVILSIYSGDEDTEPSYTNAWTGFSITSYLSFTPSSNS